MNFPQSDIPCDPNRIRTKEKNPIIIFDSSSVEKIKDLERRLEISLEENRKLQRIIIELDNDKKFFETELLNRNKTIEEYISLENRKKFFSDEEKIKSEIELKTNTIDKLEKKTKKEKELVQREKIEKKIKPKWH